MQCRNTRITGGGKRLPSPSAIWTLVSSSIAGSRNDVVGVELVSNQSSLTPDRWLELDNNKIDLRFRWHHHKIS